MVFLNRGGRFEAQPLPVERSLPRRLAWWLAILMATATKMFSWRKNFFAVEVETSRYDGGRGLWLRGDGSGGFQAVRGRNQE